MFESLCIMVRCMLVEACFKNGVGVSVYGQNKFERVNVVESFVCEDLFFVVFENGKCIIESNLVS